MRFITRILLLVSLAATFAHAQATNNIPQVQHVIVVIQENRTPTNLFHEDATLVANGAHVIPLNNQGDCGPTPSPVNGATWKCTDVAPANPAITLTALPLNTPADPDHTHYPSWYCSYDGGKMDGACHIKVTPEAGGDISGCPQGQLQYCPYSYVINNMFNPQNGILDPYFHIAEQYGFANWMFQTHQGPSQLAHMFLFAGTSSPDYYNDPLSNCGQTDPDCWHWFVAENPKASEAGCMAQPKTVAYELPPATSQDQNPLWQPGYTPPPPTNTPGFPCYTPYTMVNLLQPTGISWRYYAGNTSGSNQSYGIWRTPDLIQGICQLSNGTCSYKGYTNNVYTGNPAAVLQDLGAGNPASPCNLQQVSWVVPDGSWSDHPGTGSTDGGPSWVAAIVNAVGGYNNDGSKLLNQCNYWQNTVVLVVWDDWGGFFDDVLPWGCSSSGVCNGYPNSTAQEYVYGFRVPLLVVGAYAGTYNNGWSGYISGACPGGNCQGQEKPPFVHDFGSILNFIEYAFGQNGKHLGDPGGIGGSNNNGTNYPYADWFAPDGPNGPNCQNCTYSLSDFFHFDKTPRTFSVIQGAKYDTSCFLNPGTCFPNYPADPDDDAINDD